MIGRLVKALRGGAPLRPPSARLVGEVALAVFIGLLGALAFWALRLPLPWMLGSLFATTLASMARLPVAVPQSVRAPMSAVVGLLLGSSFDQRVLDGMLDWLPSLSALPVYILIVSIVSIVYLRRVVRLDPRTAYFASTPGGLAEMIILGDRMGGDMRTISLIHATRILIVVFAVPFAIRAFEDVDPSGLPAATAVELSLADFGILAGCAAGGAGLGLLLRLPAPLLIGPMLASAVTHLFGLVHGAPPAALVAIAQIFIGASVGCRFKGVDIVRVLQAMAASFGLTTIMLAITLVVALGLQQLTGLPLALLLLAYVPGGLAEMALIGFALGLDPTFIATHHIFRIGLVVFAAPLLYRVYCRTVGLKP